MLHLWIYHVCLQLKFFWLISPVLYFVVIAVQSIIKFFHKSSRLTPLWLDNIFHVFFNHLCFNRHHFFFLILFAAHDPPCRSFFTISCCILGLPLRLHIQIAHFISFSPETSRAQPPPLQIPSEVSCCSTSFIFLPLEWLPSVPRGSGGLHLEEC